MWGVASQLIQGTCTLSIPARLCSLARRTANHLVTVMVILDESYNRDLLCDSKY